MNLPQVSKLSSAKVKGDAHLLIDADASTKGVFPCLRGDPHLLDCLTERSHSVFAKQFVVGGQVFLCVSMLSE